MLLEISGNGFSCFQYYFRITFYELYQATVFFNFIHFEIDGAARIVCLKYRPVTAMSLEKDTRWIYRNIRFSNLSISPGEVHGMPKFNPKLLNSIERPGKYFFEPIVLNLI